MGPKIRRIIVKLLVVLSLIVAVGLGIRAVFNYTTGKKLGAYLAKMKAEGRPLSRSEFNLGCDDRENASPLFKAATEFIFLEESDKHLLTRLTDGLTWKPIHDEDRKKLEAIVQRCRRAIDLILEAAAKACFRSVDWKSPDSVLEGTYLVKMIQGGRLLAVDALLKAEDGKLEEAIDEILAGMRFCALCRDEPILITYLVSMATNRAMLLALNRIIAGKEVPAETLTKIIGELKPEAWRKAMARTFEVEGVGSVLETSARILRGEKIVGINSQFFHRAYNWIFRPVLKSEIVWAVGAWEEMAKAALLPYFENEGTRVRHEERRRSIPFFYRVNAVLFPHLSSVNLKEASIEALLDSGRIGLACKIYRLEHGRFPEKISDLVPGLLDKEPLDPFTGEPYFYRLKDNGFIIYSAGSNKKDDGGRSSKITQLIMEKDDDWAWRENWE
ncbi:MAG: hypothetical protein AB1715_01975 [Acidobacteriota bacterium]